MRRGTTVFCAPSIGQAPDWNGLRELVRAATRPAPGGPPLKVKVRLRDHRAARDETIVIA